MKRNGVYDASRVYFRGSNLLSCIVAVLCDGDYQSQVNSIEKWSAASEVCVEDVFMSFRKHCCGMSQLEMLD